MTAATPTSTPNPSAVISGKKILLMLIGAILGAAVGFAFMLLAKSIGVSAKALSWFDALAIWMGIVFVSFGIVYTYLAVNRRQLAKALEGEGEEASLPATDQEARCAIMQAAVLALAGIMLLIPVLLEVPLALHPGLAVAVYAAIVALFAVQTALNIQLWRSSDEFLRQTLLSICALTFALGQAALFLYAAAERLRLVRVISSWDVVTVLLTLYLVVSFGVGLRQRR